MRLLKVQNTASNNSNKEQKVIHSDCVTDLTLSPCCFDKLQVRRDSARHEVIEMTITLKIWSPDCKHAMFVACVEHELYPTRVMSYCPQSLTRLLLLLCCHVDR